LGSLQPGSCDFGVHIDFIPPFHFYVAAFLAAHGKGERGIGWLESGTLGEEEGLF